MTQLGRLQKLRVAKGGVNSSPVLKGLLERREILRREGVIRDKRKIGLVFGGGGMKGIFGASAMLALVDRGLNTELFDLVVGVSSGAANSAYFMAENGHVGLSIYSENLANRQFIDLWRLQKVMDLSFLEKIFRTTKRLDQKAVKSSRPEFFVGLTNMDSGGAVFIDAKATGVDVVTAVCASCAIPLIANSPIFVNGIGYFDGEIGCGIPFEFALHSGCTDVLVILNDKLYFKDETPSLLERAAMKVLLKRFGDNMIRAILLRAKVFNQSLEMMTRAKGVNVTIICPEASLLGSYETNRRKIEQVSELGRKTVEELFTGLQS